MSGNDQLDRERLLEALRMLANELKRKDVRASLIVCGGGALSLLHLRDDYTRDLDSLRILQSAVKEAVAVVGSKMGISEAWLNHSVHRVVGERMPRGWVVRAEAQEPLFSSECLVVLPLARIDFIFTKLFALVAYETRGDIDFRDLMRLRPTDQVRAASLCLNERSE